MKKYRGQYLMMIEGSVPLGADGAYCCVAGKSARQSIEEVAAGANAVIAWGTCACSGCVQGAKPNPTRATPAHQMLSGVPLINVQGCPPIAEVMAGTVVYLLAFVTIPQLDALRRPLAFYSARVHDTCYRRAYYDAGLFVESFDDQNARRGYCLYKMGCRGPATHNACGVMRWNKGVSYPIESGHGCRGCSEEQFWDNGPFYRHLPPFPGFGIETTANTIGLCAAGATAVGIASHAVATNIRKRKMIREELASSKIVTDARAEQGGEES